MGFKDNGVREYMALSRYGWIRWFNLSECLERILEGVLAKLFYFINDLDNDDENIEHAKTNL